MNIVAVNIFFSQIAGRYLYFSICTFGAMYVKFLLSSRKESPVHHFVMPLDIVEIRLDQVLLCAYQKGQCVHLILSLCVLRARWFFQ